MSKNRALTTAATSFDQSTGPAGAATLGKDDLIVNGGFDFPVAASSKGRFREGQAFNGWLMTSAAAGGKRVMQLWSAELGQPLGGPFPHGTWAGLTGTIRQLVPTEAGASYRLSYLSRAAGWDRYSPASSWVGGNTCDVSIDGVIVQTIVTVAEPLHTSYEVYFTATASETTLSFGILGHKAVGLDNVSLVKIRVEDPFAPDEEFPGWVTAFARHAV